VCADPCTLRATPGLKVRMKYIVCKVFIVFINKAVESNRMISFAISCCALRAVRCVLCAVRCALVLCARVLCAVPTHCVLVLFPTLCCVLFLPT
jgi:hypothetical protein